MTAGSENGEITEADANLRCSADCVRRRTPSAAAQKRERPEVRVTLTEAEGRRLELLYGGEPAEVSAGGFVTRLLPREVKVFATGRNWESGNLKGREYAGVVNQEPAGAPASDGKGVAK